MRYEFRCRSCGTVTIFGTSDPEPGHDDCPGPWQRIWSFAIAWPLSDRGH